MAAVIVVTFVLGSFSKIMKGTLIKYNVQFNIGFVEAMVIESSSKDQFKH